jgi:hypothetical protein
VVARHRRSEIKPSLASVSAPANAAEYWPETVVYGQAGDISGPATVYPRFGPAGNGYPASNDYDDAGPRWAPAPEGLSWQEWDDWQNWGPPPALHPDHPSAPMEALFAPGGQFGPDPGYATGRFQNGHPANGDSLWIAGQVLALADGQAALIAQEAQQYAAAIREAAERDAAAITQLAANRADAMTQQATGQAAAIREAAEREVDELRARLMSMSGELGRVAANITDSLAAPATPAIPQALTGTAPALPGARSAPPATRPARPDTRQARPDTGPARPDIRPVRPDSRPGTRPAGPATPRTATAKKALKPARQHQAMRIATFATAALVLAAITAGGAEIGLHGFKFFVFREGGVGQTSGSETDHDFLTRQAAATHHVVTPKGRHHKTSHLTAAVHNN